MRAMDSKLDAIADVVEEVARVGAIFGRMLFKLWTAHVNNNVVRTERWRGWVRFWAHAFELHKKGFTRIIQPQAKATLYLKAMLYQELPA
jgi:hypothetical protein